MGALRTIGRWLVFILFCGCMGICALCAFTGIKYESGVKFLLCIISGVLPLLNCVLYFIKMDKDNKVLAGLGCLALCIIDAYLAFSSENPSGLGVIFAVVGLFLCFTVNAFHKISDMIGG